MRSGNGREIPALFAAFAIISIAIICRADTVGIGTIPDDDSGDGAPSEILTDINSGGNPYAAELPRGSMKSAADDASTSHVNWDLSDLQGAPQADAASEAVQSAVSSNPSPAPAKANTSSDTTDSGGDTTAGDNTDFVNLDDIETAAVTSTAAPAEEDVDSTGQPEAVASDTDMASGAAEGLMVRLWMGVTGVVVGAGLIGLAVLCVRSVGSGHTKSS